MHALGRIHECLKTDGVLLDIHPQPRNSRIEVWQNGHIYRLGEIDQHEDHEEIEAARKHLKTVVKDGRFIKVKRYVFELLEHHPSVESWQEMWAADGYRLVAEKELLDTARDLLNTNGGELVVRGPVRATSLRRLHQVAKDDLHRT